MIPEKNVKSIKAVNIIAIVVVIAIIIGVGVYSVIINKTIKPSAAVLKNKQLPSKQTPKNTTPVFNEKELRDAVFFAVENVLKAKFESTKDPGYATWDKIINITGIDPSQKAAKGKWRAKDAWDWIAWQEDDAEWKVLISLDGFDCEELDKIPAQYGAFFKDTTFPSGKKYCY